MIKKAVFSILFLIALSSYSQGNTNLNNYKYIIIPTKFDFVKTVDKYKTSSLTQFLFKKKGYTVYMNEDRFPDDLTKNRCLALTANVVDNSSLFITKMNIVLKDCFNRVVYTSVDGKSRQKDYKKSYQEGIRNAFKSIEKLPYSYIPNSKDDVIIEKKDEKPVVKEVVEAPSVIIDTPKKEVIVKTSEKMDGDTTVKEVLYAQPKKNGFQLVNLEPKIVFQLLRTTTKDFFIIKDKNGVLYKKGENWIAEFYENNKLIQKQYQIKF